MKYGIYKNARNASWKCLIDCNIKTVPINPVVISEKYGIKCKSVKSELLGGSSGIIRKNFIGVVSIYYDKEQIETRQKFTMSRQRSDVDCPL